MAFASPASTSSTAAVRACATCLAMYRTDFVRCPLDGGELAVVAADPLVGATLGTYRLDSLIGEGGMGRVYRAHRDGRWFALKVLLGDLAASALMRERFVREAEAARRLAHPNIVGVVDFGYSPAGLPYLVMDLVEGTTVARMLQSGPLAPELVNRIARQLCEALDHAHKRGVIHRDFKPDNMLVLGEGGDMIIRIADFGLALATGGDVRLTMTGVACTPAYAAPEQLRGGAIDSRVDLYALGTSMFEMLTGGRLPFDGDFEQTIAGKLASDAPSLMSIIPGMQPALATLVARLLAHDPERRPRTARAVMFALDAALRAPQRIVHTVELPPVRKPAVSFPSPRGARRRAVRSLGVVTGVALMAGAIAWWSLVPVQPIRRVEAAPVVKMPVVATAATPPAAATAVAPQAAAATARPARTRRIVRAVPDAVELATTYGAIGRQLEELEEGGDENLRELWERYTEIDIDAAIETDISRAESAKRLHAIEARIRERRVTQQRELIGE